VTSIHNFKINYDLILIHTGDNSVVVSSARRY